MKRVILQKRIYWWRFFFDTFRIRYSPEAHPAHIVWVCRLMIPCADNYRPPKPCNDNKPDWSIWPWV